MYLNRILVPEGLPKIRSRVYVNTLPGVPQSSVVKVKGRKVGKKTLKQGAAEKKREAKY